MKLTATLQSTAERIEESKGTLQRLLDAPCSLQQYDGRQTKALVEIRRLAEAMKNVLNDIKENPNKYFKFSLF